MSRPNEARKAERGSNDTAAVGAETAAVSRADDRTQASNDQGTGGRPGKAGARATSTDPGDRAETEAGPTAGRPTVRGRGPCGRGELQDRLARRQRRGGRAPRDRRAGARGSTAAGVPAQRDGFEPEARDEPGHHRPRHRGRVEPILRHGRAGGRAGHPGARDARHHRQLGRGQVAASGESSIRSSADGSAASSSCPSGRTTATSPRRCATGWPSSSSTGHQGTCERTASSWTTPAAPDQASPISSWRGTGASGC